MISFLNLRFNSFLLIGYFLFYFFLGYIFAQGNEQITITTYYPSPYGSYQELRANVLAIGVGETLPDPTIAAQRDLRLVNFQGIAGPPPMAAFPGATPVQMDGTIYYDSTLNDFFYYSDSALATIGWPWMYLDQPCYTAYQSAACIAPYQRIQIVLNQSVLCRMAQNVSEAGMFGVYPVGGGFLVSVWGIPDDTYYMMPSAAMCNSSGGNVAFAPGFTQETLCCK